MAEMKNVALSYSNWVTIEMVLRITANSRREEADCYDRLAEKYEEDSPELSAKFRSNAAWLRDSEAIIQKFYNALDASGRS